MIKIESTIIEIDKKLDFLVKKIELLNYINPINIEAERIAFFKANFSENPKFIYPKLDFDAFDLQRQLFNLEIETIEDDIIRNLYEDVIYEYSGLIECIATIGKGKKFYYNSLRSFGTPTEINVENAKFILHFNDEIDVESSLPKFNVHETEKIFREYSKQYNFSYQIKHSDKLSAIAMVLSNDKTLILNKNYTFSQSDVDILTNHEIGIHMVTTMNAENNKLRIFSHGFPNNVETQEGLAVLSEYMSNSITLDRLKTLAYRVIAVESLEKGYDFVQTFKLLSNNYNLEVNKAFNITLRVHRGGGFTKDYLYLTGLKKAYDYYKSSKDLNCLLVGKTTLEYADTIKYLITNEYATKAVYKPDSFKNNKSTKETVNFILNKLK